MAANNRLNQETMEMNIRIVALLIAFIALPTEVLAGDRAVTAAATERAAILKTVGRGSGITSNNQQYQILPGVRAAESRSNEQPQQTLMRIGGDKLIETKGSFVVFTAARKGAANAASVDDTSFPTAYNPRTGGIGIVPGTLNVKLKDSASAIAVARDHGLEVVRVFAHLRTTFYRVKAGQDVVSAAASLNADRRVESAEVEVIEHMDVPH